MELSFNFRHPDLRGFKNRVKTVFCLFLSALMILSSFAMAPAGFTANAGAEAWIMDGNTLYLTNYVADHTISGDACENQIFFDGDLNIVLSGKNYLNMAAENGIYVKGKLNISGDGELFISNNTTDIYAIGDLTVSGPVTISAATIKSRASIFIGENSTLTADSINLTAKSTIKTSGAVINTANDLTFSCSGQADLLYTSITARDLRGYFNIKNSNIVCSGSIGRFECEESIIEANTLYGYVTVKSGDVSIKNTKWYTLYIHGGTVTINRSSTLHVYGGAVTTNTANSLFIEGGEVVANSADYAKIYDGRLTVNNGINGSCDVYGGEVSISSATKAVQGKLTFDPTKVELWAGTCDTDKVKASEYFGAKYIYFCEKVPLPGDVSGDDVISSRDAGIAYKAALGLEELSEARFNAADVDKDGICSAADARLILRASLGLENITDGAPAIEIPEYDENKEYDYVTGGNIVLDYTSEGTSVNFSMSNTESWYSSISNAEYLFTYDPDIYEFTRYIGNADLAIANGEIPGKVTVAVVNLYEEGFNTSSLGTIVLQKKDGVAPNDYEFTLSGNIDTLDGPAFCNYKLSNHIHSYITTTVPAGCTENGLATYTCSGCGYSYDKILYATGHYDREEYITDENGELIQSGIYDGYCNSCGTLHITNYGDVDFNNTVQSADARLILRYLVGLTDFNDAQKKSANIFFENADDSAVDSADVQVMLYNFFTTGKNSYPELIEPSDAEYKKLSDVTAASDTALKLEIFEGNDGYYVDVIGKNIFAMTSFDAEISYNAKDLKYISTDISDEFENVNVSGSLGIVFNKSANGIYKLSGAFTGEGQNNDETVIATLKFRGISDFDSSKLTISSKIYMSTDYTVSSDECSIIIDSSNNTTEAPETTTEAPETTTEAPEATTQHIHSFRQTIVFEPDCISIGESEHVCECGEIYRTLLPATGHTDNNSDGICDNCGNDTNSKNEPLTSFFDEIKAFFEKIAEFLKNLFGMS